MVRTGDLQMQLDLTHLSMDYGEKEKLENGMGWNNQVGLFNVFSVMKCCYVLYVMYCS